MKIRVVLQARMGSTRLPGKSLLPVAGFPLAVLAALRAANTGHDVVVAIPDTALDDLLSDALAAAGVKVFRGHPDDVLARFVGAVADLADEDLVVRYTADNVLPDGAMLDEWLADFGERGLDYLLCMNDTSGLPYGVAGEVLRVGDLRQANATLPALDDSGRVGPDREHVTPSIRARLGRADFERHAGLGLGHLRSTVDQLDDYLTITKAFAGVPNPIAISAVDLAQRLSLLPTAPVVKAAAGEFVLGTAQLGLTYGIANVTGQPDAAQAAEMLHTAIRNGIGAIDTARAYGNSEEVIGAGLAGGWDSRVPVITKLGVLPDVAPDAEGQMVALAAEVDVLRSCRALRRSQLETLLLHRAEHRTAWGGAVWRRLLELRDAGTIGRLGVSVQSPAELLECITDPDVEHVQLPYNLLDYRWGEAIVALTAARAERPLTIHVRSVLLQGLLTSTDAVKWRRAGVDEPEPVISALQALPAALGRRDLIDLSVAYVRAQPWVDGLVMGVETVEQLTANLALFDTLPLSAVQVVDVDRLRPTIPADSLNPATWKAA